MSFNLIPSDSRIKSYLSEDAEFVHRVDNAEECINGFSFFADHGLVDVKVDAVMVEVLLHLFSIDVEDIGVHNGEAPTPTLVTISQLASVGIEDAINKGEIVFNLLVALDMEASCRFGD